MMHLRHNCTSLDERQQRGRRDISSTDETGGEIRVCSLHARATKQILLGRVDGDGAMKTFFDGAAELHAHASACGQFLTMAVRDGRAGDIVCRSVAIKHLRYGVAFDGQSAYFRLVAIEKILLLL